MKRLAQTEVLKLWRLTGKERLLSPTQQQEHVIYHHKQGLLPSLLMKQMSWKRDHILKHFNKLEMVYQD